MEIVIENPGELGTRCHAVPSPEYYASLANQRLLTGAEVDVSTPVRRVDRSGLLEMPQPKHAELSTSTSLRRIDRLGLLESVAEVPDHVAYAKSRLAEGEERRLTGAEGVEEEGPSSLTLPRYRSRERRGSFDPASQQTKEQQESKELQGCFGTLSRGKLNRQTGNGNPNHVEQMIARFSPVRTPTPITQNSSAEDGDQLKGKSDGIGRLSPRPKNEHRISSAGVGLSIPDVIEAHEPPGSNSNSNTGSRSGTGNDSAPEGERAEAEGCEHTAIENLEEGRVKFKGQKKILQNDNIQTLRVIILSEQL